MLKIAAFLALCALASADVYMHNPRGNNDRLNEDNTNRNNGNRLFDSQNNAKGGYCWGPAMTFYEGSQLSIEWTNQHGCGSDKLYCNIVFQFMCSKADAPIEDRVRDGTGTTTDTIPEDASVAEMPTYGMNENQTYYRNCKQRRRNFGLFIADRRTEGGMTENNRNRAINTRQNNGGTRNGYECPEERDYYPYWHPSPWMDIAVLTENTDWCSYYKRESQNVKGKHYCTKPNHNSEKACVAADGLWVKEPSWGIKAPDCVRAPWNRENHLGNGGGGYTNQYNWTIDGISGSPQMDCLDSGNCECVLRMRYNISQIEAGSHNPASGFLDSNSNGLDASPVIQDPTLYVEGLNLTLAIDTTQFGRTFQDRSFVFHIEKRPSGVPPLARIYNLNVRGKRGNIVETYPSTEYDFAPSFVTARVGDYIHFQWTGCDNNPQGNAGEGRAKTDRSNIVEIAKGGTSHPASDKWLADSNTLFESKELRQFMSYAGQNVENCPTYAELAERNNNNENQINQDGQNCFVLNAAPQYFNGGLIKMNKTGSHFFISTRNNNFTNRDQRGYILIAELLPAWAIALVVIGAAVFLVAAAVAGAMVYARHHPHSAVAQYLNKI